MNENTIEPVGFIECAYAYELLREAQSIASSTCPAVFDLILFEVVDSGVIGLLNKTLQYDPDLVMEICMDDLVVLLKTASVQAYINYLPACSFTPLFESSLH